MSATWQRQAETLFVVGTTRFGIDAVQSVSDIERHGYHLTTVGEMLRRLMALCADQSAPLLQAVGSRRLSGRVLVLRRRELTAGLPHLSERGLALEQLGHEVVAIDVSDDLSTICKRD